MPLDLCSQQCAPTTDPVAFVREVEDSLDDARSLQVQNHGPVLAFAARGAFDVSWTVVTVYLVIDPPKSAGEAPGRWWLARRSEAGVPASSISWADTRGCRALALAVARVDGISMSYVPLAGNEVISSPPRFQADGTLVTLWSDRARQSDGWPLSVSLSAFGGPLSDWGVSTLRETQTCWKQDRPAL